MIWIAFSIFAVVFACTLIILTLALYNLFLLMSYRRTRADDPLPDRTFASDSLPTVTVQLPVYNEGLLARRCIDAASGLDYPRELLDIQVLDDSNDETTRNVIRTAIVSLRDTAPDLRITHLTRDNRENFKAGCLKLGMEKSDSDYFAIFDVDFLIPADFLHRMIHYFTEPMVGCVQARWSYYNRHESVLTELAAAKLDLHQMAEQAGRARRGLVTVFHGTAGIWSGEALRASGGWNCASEVEDVEVSTRASMEGYRLVYLDHYRIPSELPTTYTGYVVQQMRWRRGWSRLARSFSAPIWHSHDGPWRKIDLILRLNIGWAVVCTLVMTLGMLPFFIVAEWLGWTAQATVSVSSLLLVFLLTSRLEHRTLREDPGYSPPQRLTPFVSHLPLGYTFAMGMAWPLLLASFQGLRKERSWEVTPKSPEPSAVGVRIVATSRRPPDYVPVIGLLAVISAALAVLSLVMQFFIAAAFYAVLFAGTSWVSSALFREHLARQRG